MTTPDNQTREGKPVMTEEAEMTSPAATTPGISAPPSLEELAGAAVLAEGKGAAAACPPCEWRSRRSLWWAVAQDRADKHNNEHHSVLNPAPGTPPKTTPKTEGP
jgi:hypothetical protein